MGKAFLPKLFVVVLLVTTLQRASIASECAYSFRFPDLTSDVLSPQIGTNISLVFCLEASSSDCHLPDNFRITVAKRLDGFQIPLCHVNHIKGKCYEPLLEDTCECLSQNGWYSLSKTFEKSDYTSWVWRTKPSIAEEAVVKFTSSVPLEEPANFPNTTSTGLKETAFFISEASDARRFDGLVKATTETGREYNTERDWTMRTVKPETETSRGDDIWPGTGAVVLGSLAIVGVTATVITIIVVRAKKGWRRYDSQPRPRNSVDEDNGGEDEDLPDAPAYHLYMEILEDPKPSTEADASGLISSARVSSEDVSDSYERPVNPDYTTPNPVYQPLRHLYETVRQWRHSKRDSRSLDQEK